MGTFTKYLDELKSLDDQVRTMETSLKMKIEDMVEQKILPEVRKIITRPYQLEGYAIHIRGDYACVDLKIPRDETCTDLKYAPSNLIASWNAALRELFQAKENEYGIKLHGFNVHPRG